MLVLTRNEDESIVIDGNIVVTIVAINGSRVRVGVQAPDSVSVHRQEVFEAIQDSERKQKTQSRTGTEILNDIVEVIKEEWSACHKAMEEFEEDGEDMSNEYSELEGVRSILWRLQMVISGKDESK
jgi:carbon storage regulator